MSVKLEILEYSYWEHYKSAKDLARILPYDHPRLVKLTKEINAMSKEMHALKEKMK
jgi:hypothetical protein